MSNLALLFRVFNDFSNFLVSSRETASPVSLEPDHNTADNAPGNRRPSKDWPPQASYSPPQSHLSTDRYGSVSQHTGWPIRRQCRYSSPEPSWPETISIEPSVPWPSPGWLIRYPNQQGKLFQNWPVLTPPLLWVGQRFHNWLVCHRFL